MKLKDLGEFKLSDFERIELDGVPLYTLKGEDFQLCLESCMGGFCVALYETGKLSEYDEHYFGPDLLVPKMCTDMDIMSIIQNRHDAYGDMNTLLFRLKLTGAAYDLAKRVVRKARAKLAVRSLKEEPVFGRSVLR